MYGCSKITCRPDGRTEVLNCAKFVTGVDITRGTGGLLLRTQVYGLSNAPHLPTFAH